MPTSNTVFWITSAGAPAGRGKGGGKVLQRGPLDRVRIAEALRRPDEVAANSIKNCYVGGAFDPETFDTKKATKEMRKLT